MVIRHAGMFIGGECVTALWRNVAEAVYHTGADLLAPMSSALVLLAFL